MIKVITYGTYDMLHHGHIKLLERAKALGDYLIVGVTSDDFDRKRGKINSKQSLDERIAAVRETGLADKIIVEEYEGQKIDDIKNYKIDVFTVGSDWVGHFDYLKEYCNVIYLPRTEGISSSEKRTELQKIKIGIVGSIPNLIEKFIKESNQVNGVSLVGIHDPSNAISKKKFNLPIVENIDELYDNSDAIYLLSNPKDHYHQIKKAIEKKKHVLCESPITMDDKQTKKLFDLAYKNNCVLQEGIKTAYATAYRRMLLLLKSNVIGDIISVESTCTSLESNLNDGWSGITYWAPTALLPGLEIFGPKYVDSTIVRKKISDKEDHVIMSLIYPNGVVVVNAGCGVKSEGSLIISGTKGYVYVPSPWWKTDYFEIRYENSSENKKYFYQLDGEGIRYEIMEFLHSVYGDSKFSYINQDTSIAISKILKEIEESKKVHNI